MKASILLSLGLGLLSACAQRAADEATPTPAAAAESPRKTVLDEQRKALEKAKAVQATIDDAAAAQRKAIDEAGG